jgi:hypothetical protein
LKRTTSPFLFALVGRVFVVVADGVDVGQDTAKAVFADAALRHLVVVTLTLDFDWDLHSFSSCWSPE